MRRSPMFAIVLSLFAVAVLTAGVVAQSASDSTATPPTTVETLPPLVPVDYAAAEAAVAQYQHEQTMQYLSDVGAWLQAQADQKAAEEAAAKKKAAAAKAQQSAPRDPVYSSGGGLNSFLLCVRQRESGGDYSARNPSSSASGAFQFLDSTWQGMGYAAMYGVPRAYMATPEQQDAAAIDLYNRLGKAPWHYPPRPC